MKWSQRSVSASGTPERFAPYWAGDSFDGRGGAPGLARIRPRVMPMQALQMMLGGGSPEGMAMRRNFGWVQGTMGGISPETLDILREIRMRRYMGLDSRMYGQQGSPFAQGGGMATTIPMAGPTLNPGQGPGRTKWGGF